MHYISGQRNGCYVLTVTNVMASIGLNITTDLEI